jgi:precorrin-2 dehydrogenase / sirohydrochlorin ferrochelatase
MRFYPVNLNIAGRPCLVIGGGAVAERKVRGLLGCDALVSVISPELSSGLLELEKQERIVWRPRPYRPGDLAGFFLVIAATDNDDTQQAVQAEAARENILLNVADVPGRCNFILPSILSRGDLTISVSTGGKSPALAKQVREQLEGHFGPEYEPYLEMLGILRTAILNQGFPSAVNKILFQKLLHPEMPAWFRAKNWARIESHLRSAMLDKVALDCLGDFKDHLQSSAASACP